VTARALPYNNKIKAGAPCGKKRRACFLLLARYWLKEKYFAIHHFTPGGNARLCACGVDDQQGHSANNHGDDHDQSDQADSVALLVRGFVLQGLFLSLLEYGHFGFLLF
jgi:hypothetical protein